MKVLLLMRHAKSSWKEDGLEDHQRPLNARGLRDAPRMGVLVSELDTPPQRVISSTAVRAETTTRLACDEGYWEAELEFTDDLYLASPRDYLQLMQQTEEEISSLMMVGHNPGIEQLIQGLSGEVEAMPTAALAVLMLPCKTWADVQLDGSARLEAIYRPKELN